MRSLRIQWILRILCVIKNAKAMTQLTQKYPMLALLALLLMPVQVSAQECAANWSPKDYKSFIDLQGEVRKRFGEVRILRVALCDQGGNAYFQVVIISGHGEVRRVQVAAAP